MAKTTKPKISAEKPNVQNATPKGGTPSLSASKAPPPPRYTDKDYDKSKVRGGPQEANTPRNLAKLKTNMGKGATSANPFKALDTSKPVTNATTKVAKAGNPAMSRFVAEVAKREGATGLNALVKAAIGIGGDTVLKGALAATGIGGALMTVMTFLHGKPAGANPDEENAAIQNSQGDPNFVNSGTVPPDAPTQFPADSDSQAGPGIPEMPPAPPTMPPDQSSMGSGSPMPPPMPAPTSGPPNPPSGLMAPPATPPPGPQPIPQPPSSPPAVGPAPQPGQQDMSNPNDIQGPAGAAFAGQAQGNTQYPVFNKNSLDAVDFRTAFAEARRTQGPNAVFQWHGRMYTTKLKGEK